MNYNKAMNRKEQEKNERNTRANNEQRRFT